MMNDEFEYKTNRPRHDCPKCHLDVAGPCAIEGCPTAGGGAGRMVHGGPRQSGRTSRQMHEAPVGAAFVWCMQDLTYPKALAVRLGRTDLKLMAPAELNGLRGSEVPAVVVDHAAQLDFEQAGYVAKFVPAHRSSAARTDVVDARARAVVEPLLQFFEFGHLPPKLQDTSRQFYTLAHDLVAVLPRNPERTVALRKLLEAKDCAVRAMVFKP